MVAAYGRLCASRSPNRPATAACRRPSQICAILGAPLRRRPSHRRCPSHHHRRPSHRRRPSQICAGASQLSSSCNCCSSSPCHCGSSSPSCDRPATARRRSQICASHCSQPLIDRLARLARHPASQLLIGLCWLGLCWLGRSNAWPLLASPLAHSSPIQPARWPLLASPLARLARPARPKAVQTARQPAFALRALPLRNDRLHLCPASQLLAVPQTALAVLRYVFVGYVSVMAQPGSCNKT